LRGPSWNSAPIEQVYPWGTIRTATVEANRATGAELSEAEQDEVARVADSWIEALGYTDCLS
jgi:hypothetical protein